MTKDIVYNFFRRHRFGVLASSSPENYPEAAVVGIAATPDLKIIFDTVSNSRKYQNLVQNPHIAFVIGVEGITVQYEGIAKIPGDEELKTLLPLYFSVFPEGIERHEKWEKISYFCVEPRWIRFSDFSKSKAIIEEMEF